MESNLNRETQEYEEKVEHLEEDYISRARAVEYIASHDTQMIGRNGLEFLKGIMEVGEISLLDSSGEIFLSTDETLEGSRSEDAVMEELADLAENCHEKGISLSIWIHRISETALNISM